MAAVARKKVVKRQRSSLKTRVVSAVVVLVPALIVLVWLIFTLIYHEPLATK